MEELRKIVFYGKDQLDVIVTEEEINETIRRPLLRGSYSEDDKRYVNELELYCMVRFPENYIAIYKKGAVKFKSDGYDPLVNLFSERPEVLLSITIMNIVKSLGDMKYIHDLDLSKWT
jgi:hypothetical protein